MALSQEETGPAQIASENAAKKKLSSAEVGRERGPDARSRESWLALYKRFSHDGEVHRDCLLQILGLGGVHALSRKWMDSVCDGNSRYATLDTDEFLTFIELAEKKYHDDCTEAFKRFDVDCSGYIDKSELAAILASLEVTPMDQVLQEVLEEVRDSDQGGHDIDLGQYKHLMHLLREREGFSKQEYDRMLKAFAAFDRDGSDSLDSHEVVGVIAYLYYSLSPLDVARLLKEVDVDGSGTLSRSEFLVFMRKVRELEVRRIEAALSSCGQPVKVSMSRTDP
jgi:Ca2+-binding EF-hand superfamily protein